MAERNEEDFLDFYCPACGKQSPVLQYCSGRGEAPHRQHLMVSTDEIKNRPDPETNPDGYREWQKGHTRAPDTVV